MLLNIWDILRGSPRGDLRSLRRRLPFDVFEVDFDRHHHPIGIGAEAEKPLRRVGLVEELNLDPVPGVIDQNLPALLDQPRNYIFDVLVVHFWAICKQQTALGKAAYYQFQRHFFHSVPSSPTSLRASRSASRSSSATSAARSFVLIAVRDSTMFLMSSMSSNVRSGSSSFACHAIAASNSSSSKSKKSRSISSRLRQSFCLATSCRPSFALDLAYAVQGPIRGFATRALFGRIQCPPEPAVLATFALKHKLQDFGFHAFSLRCSSLPRISSRPASSRRHLASSRRSRWRVRRGGWRVGDPALHTRGHA